MSGEGSDRRAFDVPAERFHLYSADVYDYAADDIVDYVNAQARPQVAKSVERIKTEYVAGKKYEIWQAETEEERWWVLTNPTNLYRQVEFHSLDYLISFHIGLSERVLDRSRSNPDERTLQFAEIERRQDQIHDALDRCIEAEDFQQLGLLMREQLLSLARCCSEFVNFPSNIEEPKRGDFKGWMRLTFGQVLSGSARKSVRKHLVSSAENIWDLVCVMVHDRNADKLTALIATQAVDKMLGDTIFSVFDGGTDIDFCPMCKSREVRQHFDITIGENGAPFQSCGSCGWDNYPEDTE